MNSGGRDWSRSCGRDWSRSCGRKRSRGMVGEGQKVAARTVVVVVIVVVVSGVKFPEVVEVIELSPQPYLLVPGVHHGSTAWMMRMQYSNATRCHRYGCGMMTIADARVHRMRTRGHPRSDS